MIDFGFRKQGFHIAVSIDETNGDNSVTVEIVTDEGEKIITTGTIVFD